MRQSLTDRLYAVVFQKVKSLALSQPFECDVSASYGPQFDPAGNMVGLAHSWIVTVSIANPMVGSPALAISAPINGVVPPDRIFEVLAEQLWQKVMEEKAKAVTIKPTMDLTQMKAIK